MDITSKVSVLYYWFRKHEHTASVSDSLICSCQKAQQVPLMEQAHKSYHLRFSGWDGSGGAGATETNYPRLVGLKIDLCFNNSRKLGIQDQGFGRFGFFWGHAHLMDICLLCASSHGLVCVCPDFLFYKDTSHTRSGSTIMISFKLITLST